MGSRPLFTHCVHDTQCERLGAKLTPIHLFLCVHDLVNKCLRWLRGHLPSSCALQARGESLNQKEGVSWTVWFRFVLLNYQK